MHNKTTTRFIHRGVSPVRHINTPPNRPSILQIILSTHGHCHTFEKSSDPPHEGRWKHLPRNGEQTRHCCLERAEELPKTSKRPQHSCTHPSEWLSTCPYLIRPKICCPKNMIRPCHESLRTSTGPFPQSEQVYHATRACRGGPTGLTNAQEVFSQANSSEEANGMGHHTSKLDVIKLEGSSLFRCLKIQLMWVGWYAVVSEGAWGGAGRT